MFSGSLSRKLCGAAPEKRGRVRRIPVIFRQSDSVSRTRNAFWFSRHQTIVSKRPATREKCDCLDISQAHFLSARKMTFELINFVRCLEWILHHAKQGVEDLSVGARHGCRTREPVAHVIESSGVRPGTCRTCDQRDVEERTLSCAAGSSESE